ncbi:DUF4347 domain-containing protein [Magnetospirillum sulfuroxidans]|uniref:DUF4347 domain-containing protein n=1 Tax=Magnetospirillum sulfuroxidans TaxID=611300 RepID=A0ABS5I9K0_9PROT|nr:DUF4347 domain-containing protein [Magnetospirillum sulfuroxidans]MBR9971090.1 DUF4347 domain-containing protein [Magnetospirillum sulfuroxidans]
MKLFLEPRCLFDASVAATADHATDTASIHGASTAADSDSSGHDASTEPAAPAAVADASAGAAATDVHEILFVDTRVSGWEQLVAGARADVQVVVLDLHRDAITQISEALADRQGIETIHILSHGVAGEIDAGSGVITSATLAANANEVAAWADHLAAGADILIWGCDVGAGEAGQALLADLHNLTGADVAASTDATGAAAQGGDWVLENHTGSIESTQPIASAVTDSYDHLLAAPSVTDSYTANQVREVTEDGTFTMGQLSVSGDGEITVVLTVKENGLAPVAGTFSLAGTTGLTFTNGDGVNDATMTFKGSASDINAALAGLSYKPTANYNGNAVFDLSLTNADGSASKAVTVQVVQVNDAPVLTPPASLADANVATVNEDGTITLTPANFGIDASNLKAFDPDLDATLSTVKAQTTDQLTFEVTAIPADGRLMKDGAPLLEGSLFTLKDLIDGKITYKHLGGEANDVLAAGSQSDSFNVTIRDGASGVDTGTILIKINPVNDVPTVSASATVTAYEGRNAVPITVSVTDPDQTSTTWKVAFGALDLQGCTLYLENGSDGHYTAGVDTLIDASTMFSGTLAQLNAKLRLDVSGAEPSAPVTFTITVTDDDGGTINANVTAGDGASSAATTITINLVENNDHPVLTNTGADSANPIYAGDDNTSITVTTAMLGIVDIDSPSTTQAFTLTSGIVRDSGNGTAYLLLNGQALSSGGSFSYQDIIDGHVQIILTGGSSINDFHFDFKVRDGEITAFSTVRQVEDPIDGGTRNAADTAYLSHTFYFRFDTPAGTGGSYTPDPANQAPVIDQIIGIRASDLSEGGSVVLKGDGSGPGIVITDIDNTDGEITIRLESLPSGATILLNGVAVPLYGSFTYADLKAGNVTYRHDGGESFLSSNLGFTFSVSDGSALPVTPSVNSQAYDANDFDPMHNFSVEATPVNDTPTVSVDITAVVKEGGSVTFNTSGQTAISLSDVDGSGDAAPASLDNFSSNAGIDDLYVTVGALPAHGKLVYNGTDITAGNMATMKILKTDIAAGKLVYQHDGSETTSDSFQITVNDQQSQGNSAGDTVIVNIQVAPVNDTPIIDPSTPTAPTDAGTINTGLRVVEGGAGVIGGSSASYGGISFSTSTDGSGRAQLISTDPDNSTTQIQYRITDNVDYGKLMLNGQVLGVGSTFSQDDLDNGRVTYVHVTGNGAGEGQVTDSFSFEVGDAGPGTYPTGTFDIEVWTQTNDTPTVTASTTTVNIDDTAAASNPITGVSIADADFADGSGSVTVTVRLTDSSGTPLTLGDYAGYTITSGASGSGVTIVSDGDQKALVITGNVTQVNTYLAGLQLGSTTDPNTTLKLEVIADDRVYSGAIPQSDANGGDTNQNQTEGGNPVAIGTTTFDPYSTLVSAFGGYNVVSKTVTLRISIVDQPATVTVPGAQTANEDVGTVITGISVSDPEATGFGLNTTVTLSVGSGKINVGTQTGVTVSNNGTGTVTLTGTTANINTLLAAGVTYASAADSHVDTNGAAAGDVTLTVKVQEGAAAIGNEAGGSPGDDAITQTIAISIDPVNDAPVVNQSGAAIAVGDPNTAVDIGGFTVTDKDISGDAGNLNTAEGEQDFVQVTVRLLDQTGNPLAAGSYAGVVLTVTSTGGLVTDTTLDGTDAALQIRGTLSEVNAALAGLKLTLGATLGNTDQPYRVQVVVDDRIRNADGSLNASAADANGGELNNSNGATSAQAVPTTGFDVYADTVPSVYNLGSATRIIYPSSGNEVPSLSKPTGASATEDTRSYIGGDIVVSDTESNNFNLPVQLTLSTGGNGILSVGGSGTLADGATIAGTNVKVVSGDESGTLVLQGKASDIQALLNDATKGLFYTSAANSNNDLNGAAAGDVTVSLSLNEYQSATDFGKVAQVVTASFGVTVAPVNDTPGLTGTSLDPQAAIKASGGGTVSVALVSGAGATDVDFGDTGISTFGGGTLTISFTDGYRAGDRLSLSGTPSGVASTSGGSGNALVITLTAGATAADVKAIVEALRYQSVDADPTFGNVDPDRHFSIVLNDGNNDNGVSNAGGPAALNSTALTGIITFGYTNPTAHDNTATVTRSSAETDTGNLVTDNDGSGVDNDPEADPLKVSLVGGVNVPAVGSVDVVGTYGTLTVAADGSYTYRLDPSNATVIALGEGATLTETFGYTITDTQRTASANLVISVKAPITPVNEPSVVVTPPPVEPSAPTVPVTPPAPTPSTVVLYTPPPPVITPTETAIPGSEIRDFSSRPMEYAHAWGGERPSDVDLMLVGSVGNRFIIPNQTSNIEVPPNVFRHTNPNEPLAFEARRPDGSPLPKWLIFDARNLTFKGTPPDTAKGAVDIVIVAKDTNGNKAEAQFRILVGQNVGEDMPVQDGTRPPAAEAPSLPPNQVEAPPVDGVPVRQGLLDDGSGWTASLASGRSAFSTQLREAGSLGALAQARALLDAINQPHA